MLINRRTMLQESALGFGSLALTSMLSEDACAGEQHSALDLPHAHHAPPPRASSFCSWPGRRARPIRSTQSQCSNQLDGQRVPESIAATIPNIPRSGVDSKLFASPFSFQQYGDSGIPVSSLYPAHGADGGRSVRRAIDESSCAGAWAWRVHCSYRNGSR